MKCNVARFHTQKRYIYNDETCQNCLEHPKFMFGCVIIIKVGP